MHSVDHVLPEYQHPQLGDTIALGSSRMRIERVDPEHVLAWRSDDSKWVWTFVVKERDGRTRLLDPEQHLAFASGPRAASRSGADCVASVKRARTRR
jgi:hypothetical protein